MAPLIGITASRFQIPSKVSAPNLLGVSSVDDYARAVEAAGGIPVVIPYTAERRTLAALGSKLDGVILGGGEDPDPALYKQSPKAGLGTVIVERDELELQLVNDMVTHGKPIFGICRGIQLLNVAFGGSLWQDLRLHWPGKILHQQRGARNYLSHKLRIQEGSRVSAAMGGIRNWRCNSFHHQAVDKVAPELRAVAWDDEGLIEAVEHPEYPFVVGVQWHPENLWKEHKEAFGLFEAFVHAAAAAGGQSV
ncbi:gamma-glutamyl-gamma-aminobutyrate hydrolase family protein [Alicyclobacillus sp. SO9]|uniref:gamma-glutamyl-gamma-aminobutyrate hydrolase family protein n=1 Tax=Alicyclobacillus sp. SO9 TaxID=2665646 RepID=UPI0018E774B4|nr:gamma-glutamyl-gamma-aminobutyrate hydrolase family protein [Alicyclobacillus sp. SO9]QQE78614.1 gamma-glutamyl-gamma-aminobutyrate hydrolase family protein [Alicyclobacillus sp. SO9]